MIEVAYKYRDSYGIKWNENTRQFQDGEELLAWMIQMLAKDGSHLRIDKITRL